MRQSFAAATASIVNDQASDGIPEIFGYDVLESTTMDSSNAVGGHKNLLFFDANSFVVPRGSARPSSSSPLWPARAASFHLASSAGSLTAGSGVTS